MPCRELIIVMPQAMRDNRASRWPRQHIYAAKANVVLPPLIEQELASIEICRREMIISMMMHDAGLARLEHRIIRFTLYGKYADIARLARPLAEQWR